LIRPGKSLNFCDDHKRLNLPAEVVTSELLFESFTNEIYYPIPFKVTETLAALKGVEGALAALIEDLHSGPKSSGRKVMINLERATLFGFQALIAKVNGLSRSYPGVKRFLKGENDLIFISKYPS
jgi:hypothetical protein